MKLTRGQIGKRGKETRKRNPILLYAAEGDNMTETLYLNNFRGKGRPTIIPTDGNPTDPVKMMAQLKKQAKELELSLKNRDRAFCIIDSDTDPAKQAQIDAACARQTELIKVIISSPCFEEWFLCHYGYSTRYLTSAQAVEELKRKCKDYKKTMNIFPVIFDNTETAIKTAIRLKDYHNAQGRRAHSIERNPSSDMYIVVEYLLNN